MRVAPVLFAIAASLIACDPPETSDGEAHAVESASASPEARPASAPGEWVPREAADDDDQLLALDEANFHGPGLALPRSDALDGWGYIEPPMYYTATNLYELMDGGAAAFARLGLIETAYGVLQRIERPEGLARAAGLEIYLHQMTGADVAQTKWDEDHETGRCDNTTQLPTDVPHCLTSSSLDVLAGEYYVRFVLDSDLPPLRDEAITIAGIILEGLSPPSPGESVVAPE